jgi:hypothetical protein
MKLRFYLMTAVLGLASISVNAAWIESADVTSGVSLANEGQSISFSFTPGVVEKLWWSNDGNPGDFANQNASTIAAEINEVFGANTVNFATDFVDQGNFNGGDAGAISLNNSFNFLAIHLGTNELFFKLLSPVKEFSIFDIVGSRRNGAGLSNFRAFDTTPPNAVPVPAAVWLFGSALAGLVGTSRRKQKV